MSTQMLVLVGEGVQRRSGLLRQYLDPRWEIVSYGTEGSARPADASAAIGMPDAIEWHSAMPSLRLLHLPGAGTDGLDRRKLPAGCIVCNVHEHEASVAEYVFSCLFHLTATWISIADAALREGRWLFFDRMGGSCRPSICGGRFGILGFGHIGRRCAEIALGFNMDVLVHSRTVPAREDAGRWRAIHFMPSVPDVASAVDYLLVACPLTAETRGFLNAEVFRQMQPHAIVINVARAEIIDERALVDAISARRIGGAILDVWYRYPRSAHEVLTGSTLWSGTGTNVVVTPHLAANTEDMVQRRWRFIGANLNRFLDCGQPLNQVSFTR